MKKIFIIVLMLALLVPTFASAQNSAIVDQVTIIRDGIQKLQSNHLIKISAFSYGKLLYKFNYAIGRIKNICGCNTIDNNAIKAELKSLLDLLDSIDCSHKVNYCSCKGEVVFLRSMWTLNKLINSL